MPNLQSFLEHSDQADLLHRGLQGLRWTLDTSVCFVKERVCLFVEGRGSRVTGRGSRVNSRGSRVYGRGSRVTSRGSKNF